MEKQTAVEWLLNNLLSTELLRLTKDEHHLYKELKEQAKAMEKEQIEEAWDKRCSHGVVSQTWHIERKNAEQYYNETYGGDK
jgi:hydroxylamine reductase (hybrid-cluster protein)